MSFFTLLQVTILVAVEGEHKLSAISSSADLQLALQKLGSLSESSIQVCLFRNSLGSALSNDCLILIRCAVLRIFCCSTFGLSLYEPFYCIFWQAVEVLWTPQDENDTLSEGELLRKYPLLRSL